MQAHFHEKHAGCEHPELLGTTAIVRNQRLSCGMEFAFAGAIVEYAPVRATGIERVQNDVAGRIVEGLDEGSGKIENTGALSACPGLGRSWLRATVLQVKVVLITLVRLCSNIGSARCRDRGCEKGENSE